MRTTSDPKFDKLQSLALLTGLPEDSLQRLVRQVDEITLAPGTVLIRQGQLNRHAYLIASGSVAVDIDGELIATVAPGSIVGERTALEVGAANATVTANETTTVLAIDHRVLNGAASIDPVLGERLRDLVHARTIQAA